LKQDAQIFSRFGWKVFKPMDRNEVVVTGIGVIGPLGTTAGDFVRAWDSGVRAVKQPLSELAGTPLESADVAVLPEVNAAERLGGRRMLKYMSDAAVLGCIAAREALQNSNALNRFPPERIGLYAATGLAAANVRDVTTMIEGSIDDHGEFSCQLLGKRGLAAANPLISFKILANMPPCLISIIEGIKGPNLIFTPWEGQTGAAILEAWHAVRNSEVDCALVGAADTAACPSTFVYLRQSGILSDGEFPASGAAYLVLESGESARRDGRPAYCVVRSVELAHSQTSAHDPLSERIGRTFASAPAILLSLACMCLWSELSICGVDSQKLHIELGKT
jgi:3-oxoacyl-(acyl-carrier-protein) synthase